jgi:flagellin
MRINHNIAALNSYGRLSKNNMATEKSLEKLSSGLRINRAGDDAAGLAISEKMRAQIRGLEQATRNAQDGISLIQTAEGGLNETHSILQRMRELAVQAANDTLTPDDRGSINTEIAELKSEIERIALSTEFNTKDLLDGSFGASRSGGSLITSESGLGSLSDISVTGAKEGTYTFVASTSFLQLKDSTGNGQTIAVSQFSDNTVQTIKFEQLGISVTTDTTFDANGVTWNGLTIIVSGSTSTFQIGADEGQSMSISIGDMRASSLGVDNVNILTSSAAGEAITTINDALSTVSEQRATLGAYQNRLEHSINNLSTAAENLTASESRIRDVDMAKEMMSFTKNSILNQAATAMLAQANQQPQGVLQLLQ